MRRSAISALVIVVALGVSASSAFAATGSSKSQLGKSFSAISKVVNQGGVTFESSLNSLAKENADGKKILPVALAFANVLRTADTKISALQAPKGAIRADLSGLVKADVQTIKDLSSVGSLKPTGIQSWVEQIERDATTTSAQAEKVRTALGLPQ